MKHNDYWRKRFEQLEEAQNNKSIKYYLELEKQYKLAINSIEKDILAWYNRFAKNEGISLLEARKLLNTRELEEFKWSVEEYIKYGKENAINQKWMKELENASARVHITRLEALKLQIQQQVEVLYGNELDGIDKLMRHIYTSGYYHAAFNVQQGVNVGWSLMNLDTNRINKVISKPWTSDGLNFSERIWGKHRPALINELHTKLTQSIIRGENPKNLVNDFSKRFNVSKSQAKNLIMTESAFFASASRKDCFNDLDVEKYEIIATLDLKTSNICRELDGKVFDMKDYQVGVTAPPFHCHCRTTTAPWFEDEEGYRAAKGEDGKTYYVPSNMKYNEWYEKHIEGRLGKEKADTLRKMQLNESKDRKQFEEYKKVLGNEIPSKFDEYQHMKYNDTIRYEEAKKLYKDVNWQVKNQRNLTSGSVHSVPFESKPNSVFDNYKDGKLIQRRYYGNTGKPRLDLDLTDHRNPKQHKIVPHKHDWLADENNHDKVKREKDMELTKAHKIANKDILKGE
ncbi:minor capsid protein [Clostridioides difficile]|uniref:minor capsid protein n=1 Tax=Clostridioides difficile TaxID=1496 RepID=UPI0029C5B9B6|nr:minor capsid protein [Clostridioides difficile]MDX5639504.1 minor capsid protein [Clostridioides difficile]MDX5686510.1 minor capsid protein [Clostridioides difficile]